MLNAKQVLTTLGLIAALVLQPVLASAALCGCSHGRAEVKVAASTEVVPAVASPTKRACCAAREAAVPAISAAAVSPQPTHGQVCETTGRVHSSGQCCCVDRAPSAATTTVSQTPDIVQRAAVYEGGLYVAATPTDLQPVAAFLRFGSPAELAHASRPSVSILYGVWRN